ncbi:hypothetical protein [Bradyrhizobium sp. SK17]|uniref:hypothetical protein n=1 Tax=Bradyrhizobium sp. SK17 TaxID=2057741 RepID=UPI0012FE6533|nr:hypothetical protein [Bradyrhizobium sp. SK17]
MPPSGAAAVRAGAARVLVVRDVCTTGRVAGLVLRVPASGEGAITVTGGNSVGAGVCAYTAVNGATTPIAVSTAAAPRVCAEDNENRVATCNVPAIAPTLFSRLAIFPDEPFAFETAGGMPVWQTSFVPDVRDCFPAEVGKNSRLLRRAVVPAIWLLARDDSSHAISALSRGQWSGHGHEIVSKPGLSALICIGAAMRIKCRLFPPGWRL